MWKGLAAPAWAEAKEVGVVRILDRPFLSREVDGDGQPVPVGVVHLQRRGLGLLDILLEEEACRRVHQRQEAVVFGIQLEGVAGKRGAEQLQLVERALGDADAALVHACL